MWNKTEFLKNHTYARSSCLKAIFELMSRTLNYDFSFIQKEKGMFSFLGLTPEQVKKLIGTYSIYLVGSSRINVAGLNAANIDYTVDSILAVM
jgi:aspartate aminotransferase